MRTRIALAFTVSLLCIAVFHFPLCATARAAGKSTGVFRVLYVPVTFLDQNAAPASEATCYDVMSRVAEFYARQSFGKLTVQTTVAPPVRLPRTEAYYIAKDLEVDGLALEHSDAMAGARQLGYEPDDYDCGAVRLNGGPRAAGGWGSRGRVWTYHDDPGIVAHEIGHLLGLAHANFWNTAGVSAIGGGAAQEYGDPWDAMGLGGLPNGHFNIWAKRNLNWLADAQLWDVKQSGTHRIFAHDADTLDPARRYGMKVVKDSARTYFIEARQLRDGDANQVWLRHGAILEWRWPAKAGNNLLLDTTPGSFFGKDDGGLVLGRTFSDFEAGLHFTPVAVNFDAQKSLDLVVNVGAFSGNHAPALTLSATAGEVTTIDAAATDADGDALAYFWETGDRQVYANSAQFTRAFTSPGMYRVACTVSDMKGGATMRCAIVNVGAHSQFSIGGRVTLGGAGMPGVLVKTSTGQASTDADGFYTIAGLGAGAHTLTVLREGFTFTGTTAFTVGPGVSNADFTAAAGTFLTLTAPLPNAAEGGAQGRFTLTRTGGLAAPLTVKVQPLSGTAAKPADCALTPDAVSNAFTIPAGQAALNIDLTPVDDAIAEGPETLTLQLVPDAAYTIGGAGEATVTIADSDTALPLVSLSATLAHTIENDPAPAQFTVTRAGPASGALTVNYTISGTATNGADYAALSGAITIPGGAASADISIVTLDDSQNESGETVTLTLASSAAHLIGASGATVSIDDDDLQTVTVTAADANAAEVPAGAPNPGVFFIARSGDTAQPLTIDYALAGTARHGVDFATLPGSITIPAGASSAALTVLPVADGIGEGPETVRLFLASAGTNYRIGEASMASLTIADHAADPATIEVFASDGFAQEGGNAGAFRLTVRGGSGAEIAVSFTMSGTAQEGADYDTTAHTATIPAGAGTRTVDVAIAPMQDAIAEPVETVTLTLSPGAAYTFRNQTGSATMWLRDHEAPAVFADADRDTPMEGAAWSRFYLSRAGPAAGALAVHFTLTGTATNGADYAAVPLTATIPDGASGVDVLVTPLDDAFAEGTETIVLTLGPGSYSASPEPAVLFLQDNDGGIGAWRLAHFGSGAENPLIAGDLADPDFDGIANLLEYAQNLDPLAASTAPEFRFEPGFLTLTYRRNLAAPDISCVVQEAVNLPGFNPWSAASVIEEILGDDGTTRIIKAKVAIGTGAQHYLRLRVTRE